MFSIKQKIFFKKISFLLKKKRNLLYVHLENLIANYGFFFLFEEDMCYEECRFHKRDRERNRCVCGVGWCHMLRRSYQWSPMLIWCGGVVVVGLCGGVSYCLEFVVSFVCVCVIKAFGIIVVC